MKLSRELLLTLTCLKDVGVKGVGTHRIFSLSKFIQDNDIEIRNVNDLHNIMCQMTIKAISSVTLEDLSVAYTIARRVIETSADDGIGLIGYYDDEFPEILRNTINEDGKLDPPLLLWYRGDLSVLQSPGLAVIGTREVTPTGIAGGEYLSSEFAKRGFNIISGLAVGCDSCGHRGALNVGGKTTAFLANGLDCDSIYPSENQALAEEIVQNGGLLLSEYRIGSKVNRYSLVARDRLQAGLAMATLVVMTGVKGGTMHAANATLKAGKALFTMRFKDESTNQHEKCLGNALLVKNGAKYITGVDDLDVLSEYIKKWEPVKTELFS